MGKLERRAADGSKGEPVVFDPEARRVFLADFRNRKKRKAREAAERAQEKLRRERAERRNARKADRESFITELIESQAEMGIPALPIMTGRSKPMDVLEI